MEMNNTNNLFDNFSKKIIMTNVSAISKDNSFTSK